MLVVLGICCLLLVYQIALDLGLGNAAIISEFLAEPTKEVMSPFTYWRDVGLVLTLPLKTDGDLSFNCPRFNTGNPISVFGLILLNPLVSSFLDTARGLYRLRSSSFCKSSLVNAYPESSVVALDN